MKCANCNKNILKLDTCILIGSFFHSSILNVKTCHINFRLLIIFQLSFLEQINFHSFAFSSITRCDNFSNLCFSSSRNFSSGILLNNRQFTHSFALGHIFAPFMYHGYSWYYNLQRRFNKKSLLLPSIENPPLFPILLENENNRELHKKRKNERNNRHFKK